MPRKPPHKRSPPKRGSAPPRVQPHTGANMARTDRRARWQSFTERHPNLRMGTIIAAVSLLTALWPVMISGLHYYATEAEMQSHKQDHAREQAWNAVTTAATTAHFAAGDTVVIRNRVNECRVLRDDVNKGRRKYPMSPLEVAICDQYEQELAQGNKIVEEDNATVEALRQKALALTREKQ